MLGFVRWVTLFLSVQCFSSFYNMLLFFNCYQLSKVIYYSLYNASFWNNRNYVLVEEILGYRLTSNTITFTKCICDFTDIHITKFHPNLFSSVITILPIYFFWRSNPRHYSAKRAILTFSFVVRTKKYKQKTSIKDLLSTNLKSVMTILSFLRYLNIE